MTKKIEIQIKDGQVTIKTSGFDGKTCLKEIDKLSQMVGGLDVKERKFTTEAHQTKQVTKNVEME